jgi:hypothetical protein
MYRVHYFDTSEAAHDACLDDGPCIEEGDVLAILSEGVIGLASTDPIAVTLDPGALRIVRPMAMDVLGQNSSTAPPRSAARSRPPSCTICPCSPHFPRLRRAGAALSLSADRRRARSTISC